MLKQIYKNNLTINYRDNGIGNVIVLIHGFLESLDIWEGFNDELSKTYRVLSIDLPGHGQSDLFEKPFTMCKYAEFVKFILEEEHIDKAFMIGHSMGGYVTMSFYDKYPELLSGLCLFHSSPFADNEKKADARNETISKIKSGKYNDIYRDHVRNVYAEKNIDKFKSKILDAEKIAKETEEQSVIASLEAMRDRRDRSQLLSQCRIPVLYILGMKDKFISASILDFIDLPEKSKITILENSGHMGFTEEKEKSLTEIIDFYNTFILNS